MSATPTLVSLVPNPVQVGQTLTVEGSSELLLATSTTCSVTSSSTLSVSLPSGAPVLFSLAPNPIGAGTTLSLLGSATGDIPLSAETSCGASSWSALYMVGATSPTPVLLSLSTESVTVGETLTATGSTGDIAFSGTADCGASSSARLSLPVTLPAVLGPDQAAEMTAQRSGDNLVFEAGEYVRYRVSVLTAGTYLIKTRITAQGPMSAEVRTNGDLQGTWHYP